MDSSDKPNKDRRPMEWLNYHHLRYFWVVATEGSLAAAAAKLRISQPSISEQIGELEASLGEKLFRREGRRNVLTDAGQMVLRYAEEIFSLGQELANAVKQRPGVPAIRLYVGVADSFPKLVTNEILRPVFDLPQRVHVICREGKATDLLAQLAAHRLDVVLADESPSTSLPFRTYDHLLGSSGTTFCAAPELACKLKRGFPHSLDGAPSLLPAENTSLRRSIDAWLRELGITPQVVAEFEDLALMKVMAAEGRGLLAVPTVSLREAVERYHFEEVGASEQCRVEFHAITADRKIRHPAVEALKAAAPEILKVKPASESRRGRSRAIRKN